MVRVNGAIVSSESGDVLKISKPPLLFYIELHIFYTLFNSLQKSIEVHSNRKISLKDILILL